MKNQITKLLGILFVGMILLQGCMYDLRSSGIKKEGITLVNAKKGKAILDRAWKRQGYDKLDTHRVYSFHGSDSWRGLLGKMGKIWPDLQAKLDFKYQTGTFDGQVTFLDGEEMGKTVGLQNWNYYEIQDQNTEFLDKDAKVNRRKVFGIAAFQYFTEMVSRLRNAPIISYAGEEEFRGQMYDLVFCTWETEKPHIEHDQYMAWINKKTGLMDFTQYTIRDSYLKPPGYKAIGGAVEFADLKNIDGVLIPHQQLVYAIKLKKKRKKNLHRLIISDFEFDAFDTEDLRVDKKITVGGDFKNWVVLQMCTFI